MSLTSIFDLLEARELDALSKMCASGELGEDVLRSLHATRKISPLMSLVMCAAFPCETNENTGPKLVEITGDIWERMQRQNGPHPPARDYFDKVVDLARAMIHAGADPHQEAPGDCQLDAMASIQVSQLDEEGNFVEDEDDGPDEYGYPIIQDVQVEDQLTVPCAGRSALSLVVAMRSEMIQSSAMMREDQGCEEHEWDQAVNQFSQDPYKQKPQVVGAWEGAAQRLGKLVKLLQDTEPPPRVPRVRIPESVLSLWEASRADVSSHDLRLECADGERVSCHGHVLSLSSRPVKVMLAAPMVEGQQRCIKLHDCPRAAAALFVDLVYTGTTAADEDDLDAPLCLSALDLAHRWEATSVVAMLERALLDLVSEDHFEAIALAAALKELPLLRRACIKFGASSHAIAQKRARRELSPVVATLLGDSPAEVSAPATKKRRSF